jgi:hypothetical protein
MVVKPSTKLNLVILFNILRKNKKKKKKKNQLLIQND